MRLIRTFGRGIKDAGKSVFRNFSLSLASISSTAITLIIVGIAILFTYNVNSITKHIEDVLTVVVFIDKKADDQQVEILKDKVKQNSNVLESSFEYKSMTLMFLISLI